MTLSQQAVFKDVLKCKRQTFIFFVTIFFFYYALPQQSPIFSLAHFIDYYLTLVISDCQVFAA